MGLASTAFGQVFTWINPAGGTFSVPGNWNPAGPPTLATQTAVYNLNATYPVTLNANAAHGTLLMSAGTVALLSAVVQNYSCTTFLMSNSTLSINSNVLLGPSGVSTIGTGAQLSVNGSGVLATANNVIVDGGSLIRNNGTGFVLGATRTLIVQNGGTASFNGSLSLGNRSISVTNGLLSLSSALDLAIAPGNATLVVNGSSALGQVGGASLWGGGGFTGEGSFFGGSTGTLGALTLGADNTAGSTGRLQISSSDVIAQSITIAQAGINARGELTISGTAPTLTQTGASILIVGAATGATNGTVTISSGTFTTGTGATTINTAGRITVNGGAFLPLGNVIVNGGILSMTAGTTQLAANRTMTIQNLGSVTSGVTTGLGAINNGQTVNITSGTFSTSGLRDIGVSTDGTMIVNGANSRFITTTGTNLGVGGGNGSILLSNAGAATFSSNLAVGSAAGSISTGQLRIDSLARAHVAGSLTVGNAGGSSGTILINSGTLTAAGGARVAANGRIDIGSGGTMIVSGGSFNIAGGTVTRQSDFIESLTLPATQQTNVNTQGLLEVSGGFILPNNHAMTLITGGDLRCTGLLSYLHVGSDVGMNGTLTVFGSGSTVTTDPNGQNSGWGFGAGANATVTFNAGGAGTLANLLIGRNSGRGTLTILNGASVSCAEVFMGDNSGTALISIDGPSARLNVGSTLFIGAGGVVKVLNGAQLNTATTLLSGALQLNGGTASLGFFDTGGGPVDLVTGALAFTGTLSTANFSVLGPNPVISTNQIVRVNSSGSFSGALNLEPLTSLTLAGGALAVQSISNNGGTLIWSSGTLDVVNGLPLQLSGPIGNQLFLQAGKSLLVSNGTLAIEAGATLAMRGGQALVDLMHIKSGGQLLLDDAASYTQSLQMINEGKIFGSANIDGLTLTNAASGEIRAGLGDQFRFAGSAFNEGQLNLFGGEVEIAAALTNQPAGRISGRGVLRAGSLANIGSLLLSSGISDVFGNLTNNSGGKTIVTGTAVASFYDDVTNTAGSEFRISTGSTAVFFGLVTGTSQITGTGTAVFENGTAPAALINGGRSIVGPAGALNATVIRQVGLTIEGEANLSPNAAPSVSRLTELTIIGAPDAWKGALDLANNALIVDYSGSSPRATVVNQIKSGFNNGAWNGSGINSSAAAMLSNRAIGIAEAPDIGSPAAFLGDPIDSTTLLLRFTLPGDTNLDGMVDIGDFSLLAANFNSPAYWARGDFNYDGVVDIGDFALLASNFNQVLPTSTPGRPTPSANIPEPIQSIGVLLPALFQRRRERN